MKKSLVVLVVLVTSLAFVGTVFASGWGCYGAPAYKAPKCVDKVLCKGKMKGAQALCGPCAGMVKWSCKWLAVEKCPKKK